MERAKAWPLADAIAEVIEMGWPNGCCNPCPVLRRLYEAEQIARDPDSIPDQLEKDAQMGID